MVVPNLRQLFKQRLEYQLKTKETFQKERQESSRDSATDFREILKWFSTDKENLI